MGFSIRRYRRRELTTWAIASVMVAGCAFAGPAAAQSTTVQPVPVVQAGQAITVDTSVPQSAKSISVTGPRYSDPLADTAAVALGALRMRGPAITSSASSASSASIASAASAASSSGGGNGALNSVVVVAASPQTQVAGGIAPPSLPIVQGVTAQVLTAKVGPR